METFGRIFSMYFVSIMKMTLVPVDDLLLVMAGTFISLGISATDILYRKGFDYGTSWTTNPKNHRRTINWFIF